VSVANARDRTRIAILSTTLAIEFTQMRSGATSCASDFNAATGGVRISVFKAG
jgi:hypothetical protein